MIQLGWTVEMDFMVPSVPNSIYPALTMTKWNLWFCRHYKNWRCNLFQCLQGFSLSKNKTFIQKQLSQKIVAGDCIPEHHLQRRAIHENIVRHLDTYMLNGHDVGIMDYFDNHFSVLSFMMKNSNFYSWTQSK